MMRRIFVLSIFFVLAYFEVFSQINYPLDYLKPGFHVSYVARYPEIHKIDGCDDVHCWS